jgi:hypothetical protein
MKCKFLFNDIRYISKSKKEARGFLKQWEGFVAADISRFETTWRLKGIERAPSYGQFRAIKIEGVEYGRK